MTHTTISRCRICGNTALTDVLRFGEQYIASTFVKSNEGNELAKIKIPLTVTLCDRRANPAACGLLQLRESANRDLLYRNYFYRSNTTATMRAALRNVVEEVQKQVPLGAGDYVLDIGCNDGTMLEFFPASTIRNGLDPATNIDRSRLDASISVGCDYFSKNAALKLSNGKQYKAVTSIAMFYDLDTPNEFVREVKKILTPDGVWCIQFSYLPTTLETLNFYDVCHEHLLYYSLSVLRSLMERNGMRIFDASLNSVNGGSARIFICPAENARPVSDELQALYDKERDMKIFDPETYVAFGKKIDALKRTVLQFLEDERHRAGTVFGLGASTKGNVLLQYFDIDKRLLPAISERLPEKIGLRTLGTDIEIISEEDARARKPSVMFVLVWFFKDEIIARERAYLESGGTLFFPMPYPHLVTVRGETRLTSE